MISQVVRLVLSISFLIFMVGNLSTMGLQLNLKDVLRALRDLKFVLVSALGCFVIGPVLAWLIVLAVPMKQPYAAAVLLLGMGPVAPFLPLVVKKASGDLAAAASLMMIASIGTIIMMPFAIPLVVPGLSASAWAIEKPLVLLVLVPLITGIGIRSAWPVFAGQIYSAVNSITNIGTIAFLTLILVLNFGSVLDAIGSNACLAQLLYIAALTASGYLISTGMPSAKRSVMTLAMCTRNIGAAAAIARTSGDQRIMVMLVIAALVTVAFSFALAFGFALAARRASLQQQEPSSQLTV